MAALALAAASNRRAAGAAQAERDAAAAAATAAALRVEVTRLRVDLGSCRQDAHALATIVRRVFQLRDWKGYDPSLRALVDRALTAPDGAADSGAVTTAQPITAQEG